MLVEKGSRTLERAFTSSSEGFTRVGLALSPLILEEVHPNNSTVVSFVARH